MNPMSKRALWATSTEVPMKLSNGCRVSSMGGAVATMVLVMPVSTVMKGGMAQPGLTSVVKRSISMPPRYLTAPISVME